MKIFAAIAITLLLSANCTAHTQNQQVANSQLSQSSNQQIGDLWPTAAPEARPYARWWWLGSAVDEKNLDWLLNEYSRAGLGGLEITPIYGVQGNDKNDIPFLSAKWMSMLDFLNKKGDEVGMKIDMNTGTGWPFGGPEVTEADAACKAVFDKDGKLQIGRTKQKVKRAAPGGEGFVIDHFDKGAVTRYLDRFTKAFASSSVRYPHNFFNDSYEVYGASWTPKLFDEFKKRRGYDLRNYQTVLWEAFDSKGYESNVGAELVSARHGLTQGQPLQKDDKARIISDYRQTLGEILLENFTQTWTSWAHEHGTVTRNQAHGSPGNLIDIYAAVDIPECEGFGLSQFGIKGLRQDSLVRKNYSDLSMLKYASSAAHISGKNLVSAESFTWLTEHFRTSLSQCKPEIDLFMTAGINHMYFHGTCYSPKDDPWPGWKFYASVDMSPTNSIWHDAPAMFKYIERCQSFMQMGQPDNDFLVYVPIYDMWQENGGGLLMFDIHKMDRLAPRFIASINNIVNSGYDCDYISDNFIRTLTLNKGMLRTEGGAEYKALVIPGAKLMPHDVLEKLLKLAKKGANIVFLDQYPEDVPGYGKLDARRKAFNKTLAQLKNYSMTSLETVNAMPEEMKTKYGLSAIRRKNDTGYHYFVSSLQPKSVKEWVSLGVHASSVLLFNPMNGEVKKALTREKNGMTQVYLNLASGESCILQTYNNAADAPQNVFEDKILTPTGWQFVLDKGWKLSYPNGNPNVYLAENTELSNSRTLENSNSRTLENSNSRNLENSKTRKLENSKTRNLETSKSQNLEIFIDAPCSWTSLGNAALDTLAGTCKYSVEFNLDATYLTQLKRRGAEQTQDIILDLGDVRESARVTINDLYVGTLWAVPFQMNVGRYLVPGKNKLEIEVTNLPANRIAELDRKQIQWRKYKEINLVDLNYKKTGYAHWQTLESGLLTPPRLIIME